MLVELKLDEPKKATAQNGCLIKLAAAAYHEAGHIVLASRSGLLRLDGPITLHPGSHAEVPTACSKSCPELTDTEKYELALVAAAGSIAEKIYIEINAGTVDERELFRGAHGDVQQVRDLLGPGHWNEVCATAEKRLRDEHVWAVVVAVASKLIAKWPDPVRPDELSPCLTAPKDAIGSA